MEPEYLFVYGTLIEDVNKTMNRLVKVHSKYVDKGYMTGRLYEIDGYPGFVPSNDPNEKVLGEVYLLKEVIRLFYQLDKYEECSPEFPEPWEYQRLKLLVHLNKGKTIHDCWVYVYNRDTNNLIYIPSGDYRAFLSKK